MKTHRSGPGNCECLACREPELFYNGGIHWVVCPPCYEHLEEHFKGDPGPSWSEDVGLTGNKEECLLEDTGCVVCDKSHKAILENSTTHRFPGETSAPDNPCDSAFMEDISS